MKYVWFGLSVGCHPECCGHTVVGYFAMKNWLCFTWLTLQGICKSLQTLHFHCLVCQSLSAFSLPLVIFVEHGPVDTIHANA
jgi:hypothetical protein